MTFHYCNSQNIPIVIEKKLQSYKNNLCKFIKRVPTLPSNHQASPTCHNDFPTFSSAQLVKIVSKH